LRLITENSPRPKSVTKELGLIDYVYHGMGGTQYQGRLIRASGDFTDFGLGPKSVKWLFVATADDGDDAGKVGVGHGRAG